MPSHQDFYDDLAYQAEQHAIRNAANNSFDYLLERLPKQKTFMSIKPGAPVSARALYWVPKQKALGSGASGEGIVAVLEDFDTGEMGRYLLETTGGNGLWVTAYVGPAD